MIEEGSQLQSESIWILQCKSECAIKTMIMSFCKCMLRKKQWGSDMDTEGFFINLKISKFIEVNKLIWLLTIVAYNCSLQLISAKHSMGMGQICLDCLNGSELVQAKRFWAGTTPGWQKLSQYLWGTQQYAWRNMCNYEIFVLTIMFQIQHVFDEDLFSRKNTLY